MTTVLSRRAWKGQQFGAMAFSAIALTCVLSTPSTATASTNLGITNGLVAYYPFNGDANDATGNGYNGTAHSVNLVSDRFGQSGKAYSFNGTSSVISFSRVPLQQTDNWTMSAWVKAYSTNQSGIILSMGADDNASVADGFSFGLRNTGYNPGTGNSFSGLFSGINWIESGYLFMDTSAWHQLVMLRTNGITRFYVDGVPTANSSSLTPRMPSVFQIGAQPAAGRYFSGGIDDVRIYNRALTSDEVAAEYAAENSSAPLAIYQQPSSITLLSGASATLKVGVAGNAPFSYQWLFNGSNLANATNSTLALAAITVDNAGSYAVSVANANGSILSSNALISVIPALTANDPTNGLVAYFPFSGDASDATGNGNNGLPQGARLVTDRTGHPNSAYAFDGTSSRISFGAPPLQQTDNWTMSAWVAPYATNQYSIILSMGTDDNGSTADGFSFGLRNGGYNEGLGNHFSGLFSGLGWIDSGFQFGSSNLWHHVVMLRSNGTTRFYVDGVQTTNTSSSIPRSPSSFQIGAQLPAGRFFNGAIDDVRIYNRALTSQEVSTIFTIEAVNVPPTITQQPASITLGTGLSSTLSVGVFGGQPFTYQWLFNGTNLPNATNATLTLSSVTTNTAGTYAVLVSNSGGSVLSSNATLNVIDVFNDGTPTNGLVAYYPLAGDASDATGSGNNGQPQGTQMIPDRFGHPNSAYGFNGSSSYISFNTPPLQQTDNWTMSAWVNLYSANQFGIVLAMGFDDNAFTADGFSLIFKSPGTGAGTGSELEGLFSGVNWIDSGYQIPLTNQWHQVVMLRTNGITQFYVDGAQTLNTSSLVPRMPSVFQIGAQRSAGRYFNGGIDDVRIYNRALTPAEVGTLFSVESANVLPIFTRQPSSLKLVAGSPAVFNVIAAGGQPLSYQWLFNGANITNETNATLTIPSATALSAGSYSVIVSNPAGFVVSSNVTLSVVTPASSGSLTSGLVAYYPFDGSADDASGNGYNGLTQSITMVPDRFGNANSAFSFNGTSSYVSFANVPLQQTDNWTMSAWVNLSTTNQYSAIVAMGADSNGTANGFSLAMTSDAYNPGNSLFGLFGAVKWIDTGYRFTATSEWHHIAMQRSAGTVKFYVDGLQTANTATYAPLQPTSFQIGAQPGAHRYFNGAIDDVRIYNRVLAPEEVAALFTMPYTQPALTIVQQPAPMTVTAGFSARFKVSAVGRQPLGYQWMVNGTGLPGATNATLTINSTTAANAGNYSVLVSNLNESVVSSNAVLRVLPALVSGDPTNGLVAYYPFSSDASDTTGSGYNGMPQDALLIPDRFGHADNAYAFNGTSSYINFSSVPLRQVDNWTMSAWVNVYSTNQLAVIVSMGTDNNTFGADGFSMGMRNPGYAPGAGNNFDGLFSSIGWAESGYHFTATNQWHQLVMLRTNGTTQFYVDGVQTENTSGTTPYVPTSFQIGAQPGAARYFYGGIDDVRIYNRALTSNEVSLLFAVESSGIPLAISQQPASATIFTGTSTTLAAGVSGNPPFTYQWQFNGANIVNATNSALTLTDLTTNDSGTYAVLVSNASGSVLSSNAIISVLPPLTANDVTNGMVAYYPLNGDALDATGHGYNGVQHSAQPVADRFGRPGSAYSFDGASSYISFNNVPLQQTDNWTMSAWVKAYSTNQSGIILSMGADNNAFLADGFSFGLRNTGYLPGKGNSFSGLFSGINWIESGYLFVDTNAWHQLVMLRTNGTTMFYVDGLQTANTSTLVPRMPTMFQIGGQPAAGARYFYGAIDDVRIYNRALAPQEIGALFSIGEQDIPPTIVQQPSSETVALGVSMHFSVVATGDLPLNYQWLFNGTNLVNATNATLVINSVSAANAGDYSVSVSNSVGSTVSSVAHLAIGPSFQAGDITNGLVAYYPFGGDASDATGNGYNGTPQSAQLAADRFGHSNSAYAFNGTSSCIGFDSVPLPQTDNWTMSAWVNLATTNQLGIIASMGFDDNASLADGFSFGIRSSGLTTTAGNELFGLFSGVNWIDSGYQFTATQQWHQVVMLRSNGLTQFYVDGIQTAETSSLTPRMQSKFLIGAQPAAGRFFSGIIDDVRIYNRALAPAEVNALFVFENANVPPTIIQQPVPVTTLLGLPANFSVSVSGGQPFQYQWKLNGTNLVNATHATLTVNPVTLKDVGNYSVSVSNAGGSVISLSATLTAIDPATVGNMTNGLVAYYPFNGNAHDATGGGNDGSPKLAQPTTDRFGRVDSAYAFNGTSSYIGFDRAPLQQTDNWTISAWVNLYDFIGDDEIVVSVGADDNAYTADGFSFGFKGNELVGLLNGVEWIDTGYEWLAPGQWHQVVMSRDNGMTRCYVDGVQTPNVVYETPTTPSLFHIGGQPDGAGRYFFGAIDDVRIYNRPLLPIEVTLLFDIESAKPDTEFVLQGGTHLAVLPMNGTNFANTTLLRTPDAGAGWRAAAVADLDNDGKRDILWQNSNGSLRVWFMNGTNYLRSVALNQGRSVGSQWKAVGMADFDNDGHPDILFENSTGWLSIWFMNGINVVSQKLLPLNKSFDGTWRVAGLADLNNDGYVDIIWQQKSGYVATWLMNGPNVQSSVIIGKPSLRAGSTLVAVEDMNADGYKDLLWQQPNGVLSAWLLNGTKPLNSTINYRRPVLQNWRIVGEF